MQLSLFDEVFTDPREKLIENLLHRGSGFANSKIRIAEYLQGNPSPGEFAEFLKKEYGIGGFGSPKREPNTIHGEMHDGKGIKYRGTDNDGNEVDGFINWNQAAKKIIEMVRSGTYL